MVDTYHLGSKRITTNHKRQKQQDHHKCEAGLVYKVSFSQPGYLALENKKTSYTFNVKDTYVKKESQKGSEET